MNITQTTRTTRDLSTIASGDAIAWAQPGVVYRNGINVIFAVRDGSTTRALVVPSTSIPSSDLSRIQAGTIGAFDASVFSTGSLTVDINAAALDIEAANMSGVPVNVVCIPAAAGVGGVAFTLRVGGGVAIDPGPLTPVAPTGSVQTTRGVYGTSGGTPGVYFTLTAAAAGAATVRVWAGAFSRTLAVTFA